MKSQSPTDIFQTQPSPMPEEAPFDLSSSASTIPPAQKPKQTAVSWSSHCVNKKSPCDYARDRVEKYEKYFKDGEILPIPELVEAVEPKTLSFVVTDIKTKRLAGIKKETFEDLLKTANIPGKYFCRRSFATWDVLLPSEEVAKSLAGGNITTRFFRLQPEYRGKRRIRVTVCNVSMQLSGDVLAAYLSIYGGVEQVTQVTSTRGTAYGDYVFVMCLDRGGFNKIPHKIRYREQTMTVIVEGRKPLCWFCNNIGHFSKSCPQKTTKTTPATTTTTTETTTNNEHNDNYSSNSDNSSDRSKQNETPKTKTGDSPNKEEGWTQVVKGGKKKKTPIKEPAKQTPIKEPATATVSKKPNITTTAKIDSSSTPTTSTAKSSSSSTSARSSSSSSLTKKKNKENNIEKEDEAMDYSINLKRRRDSDDSVAGEGEKKHIKGPHQETPTQSQTPSQPQEKGEKIERPAQIIPPPQKHQNTPAHLSDFPLSPKSPSLSPIRTPKLLTRAQSVTRESPTAAASPSSTELKPRSRSASNEVRRAFTAFHFCEDILEPQNMDHILKKTLKPLSSLKKIDGKDITNPYLFKSAAMVTTFVRSAGPRTKELWHFLEGASRADAMLADLRHQSLKKLLPFCSGRVPILVHPTFYRSLKLRYPVDVGGITRDDRVSTELGTGSLRQAVGILTPKDFRPIVDTE